MRHLTPTRFIPKNHEPLTRDGVDAIVYIAERSAIGYVGKRTKRDFFYTFTSLEQRDRYVDDFFAGVERVQQSKRERQLAKQSFLHGLAVGDILYATWGYDQTNVDFYQVIRTTDKTATIRMIAQETTSTGWCQGTALPCKDSFVDDEPEMVKRVRQGDCITIRGHSASRWHGRPVSWSSYG